MVKLVFKNSIKILKIRHPYTDFKLHKGINIYLITAKMPNGDSCTMSFDKGLVKNLQLSSLEIANRFTEYLKYEYCLSL